MPCASIALIKIDWFPVGRNKQSLFCPDFDVPSNSNYWDQFLRHPVNGYAFTSNYRSSITIISLYLPLLVSVIIIYKRPYSCIFLYAYQILETWFYASTDIFRSMHRNVWIFVPFHSFASYSFYLQFLFRVFNVVEYNVGHLGSRRAASLSSPRISSLRVSLFHALSMYLYLRVTSIHRKTNVYISSRTFWYTFRTDGRKTVIGIFCSLSAQKRFRYKRMLIG